MTNVTQDSVLASPNSGPAAARPDRVGTRVTAGRGSVSIAATMAYAVGLFWLTTPAAAQAPAAAAAPAPTEAFAAEKFEVASVRPNNSGDAGVSINVLPGGRFTATDVSLGNHMDREKQGSRTPIPPSGARDPCFSRAMPREARSQAASAHLCTPAASG
jgi:hypothetical protein